MAHRVSQPCSLGQAVIGFCEHGVFNVGDPCYNCVKQYQQNLIEQTLKYYNEHKYGQT